MKPKNTMPGTKGFITRPLEKRFWEKVNRRQPDECWEWQGSTNFPGGYGVIWVNGRREVTHRVSYELQVGPIPDSLTIDHLCFNKRCVNPAHLEPVTFQENCKRAGFKYRKVTCTKGHPPVGP